MKILFCLAAFLIGLIVTVNVSPQADEPVVAAVKVSQLQDTTVTTKPEAKLEITKTAYGTTSDGSEVSQYICTNKNGLVLEMIDYGATVIAVKTPDRKGKLANITLHCNDINGYQACTSYFGSTVGRFCNRIAGGKFSIDGKQYTLATNNGPNHLHGGNVGFDKRMWDATELQGDDFVGIRFSLTSEDGDEGYPGKLETVVDYILNNENELVVDFKAHTDKPTIVNLTNHNYWNLAGAGSGDILGHQLKIAADKYLPVDDTAIPTGQLADVKNTPFDFTEFQPIGKRLKLIGGTPGGYDHCYALNSTDGSMALAAIVKDPAGGRVMEIRTTQPGLQFYSGNFLDGQPGSGGFAQHSAFCLETQHFPDAPNRSNFATTLLKPGEHYHQKTIHKFSVE
jgi:aldose 1-epimerase